MGIEDTVAAIWKSEITIPGNDGSPDAVIPPGEYTPHGGSESAARDILPYAERMAAAIFDNKQQ